ncbi:MAG: hypothetical protein JXJ17_09600 [Anaerolineae bacterium]|nr:hypothetical protein [Anaerolineae bacterium]
MAPNRDELLSSIDSNFVVAHGNQTLYDAVQLLKEQGGQDWWYLIVDIGARFRFLATRFSDLRDRVESEGSLLLNTMLRDVGPPLFSVHLVDLGTNLPYALNLASENPNGLVVVVEMAKERRRTPTGSLSPLNVIGVLSLSATRGAVDMSKPSLDKLIEKLTPPSAPDAFDTVPVPVPFESLVDIDADLQQAFRESIGDAEELMKESEELMEESAEPELPAQPAPSSKAAPAPAADEEPPAVERGDMQPSTGAEAPAEEAKRKFAKEGEEPRARREMAPPPTATPSAAAPAGAGLAGSPFLDVSVGGDVKDGGEVNVAGRDINITKINTFQEKEKKQQDRRFEAAFPHEVHQGKEYKLWVAVMLPDAPSPFSAEEKAVLSDDTSKDAAPVGFEVDPKTGDLIPAKLDVTITGDGFEVLGEATKVLTVQPDGQTTKRWFLVRAEEEGPQQVLIEISQEGHLIKELTVEAAVFAVQKKPQGLNLSLRIAAFSLSLTFGIAAA